MGVSLAKESYVRDARPVPDIRMMTGALLLQLQAARTPNDLMRNARSSAPAILALCDLSHEDLDSIAPIDRNMVRGDRRKRLDDALGVLIRTLYAASPCPERELRRQVLAVAGPLRAELADARTAWWCGDDMATMLADRLWSSRPTTWIGTLASIISHLFAAFATLIRSLPGGSFGRTAIANEHANALAQTPTAAAYSIQVQPFMPLDDPALLAELDSAWRAFRVHSPETRDDALEAKRIEDHLSKYARSFEEAWETGGLGVSERVAAIKTLRTIIGLMDGASGRVPASPTRGLEALEDPALLADVERARSALRKHLELAPVDADEAARVEDHLSDLTARFSSTLRTGASISPGLRDGTVLAVRSLVASMDAISSRSAMQATQDLETEIRFIVSAHGTSSDALQLPAGRMNS